MKKEEIIIYTNEQCSYCKQIKEELSKNDIKFEERLTKDWEQQWKDIVNLVGIPTVPTMYYKNNYFVPGRDFQNPQHLMGILNYFEESKFALEIQIFEKLKTLNYHISSAFGKTDQLLKQIESKLLLPGEVELKMEETNTKKDEHKSNN